jgi:ferredoxin
MSQAERWTVSVDAERCQGHNRCYAIAPELFEIDDFGNATAKGDGAVPQALEDKARLAAKNCPEHAVGMSRTAKP